MCFNLPCCVFSGKVIIAMDGLFGKTVGSKKRFNCSVWFCFEDIISLYYIIQFHHRNRFTLFFRLNTKKYCMLHSRTTCKGLILNFYFMVVAFGAFYIEK